MGDEESNNVTTDSELIAASISIFCAEEGSRVSKADSTASDSGEEKDGATPGLSHWVMLVTGL